MELESILDKIDSSDIRIVSVVGSGISKAVTNRLTCSLDFYPTFCDWANIPQNQRPPLEGKSFAQTCTVHSNTHDRQEILVAFEDVQTIITDDNWRLTRFTKDDKGQLLNLNNDLNEEYNLYNNPQFAEKKNDLLCRLITLMAQPSLLPNYRNLPIMNFIRYFMCKGIFKHLVCCC